MHIGFDAKRLFHNQTGLGVYSRLLLHALHQQYPKATLTLFDRNPGRSPFIEEFAAWRIVTGKGPLWRTSRITRSISSEKLDLYHGLSHELPLGMSQTGIPGVVTMHDLIFRKDPAMYRWLDRQIYDWKWKHACQTAARIIAVSEHTRLDLMEIYSVPADRIRVVPPPVALPSQPNDPSADAPTIKKYNLDQPYWLYVGAINERKNLIGLLQAMRSVKTRLPLLVVGSGQSYEREARAYVARHQLERWVKFVGHVHNASLAVFYRHALALIYPSRYEGFGIPIVEALHLKTPVITSNTSSMPEAAGPGALLIDPHDPETIAAAMDQLCDDRELALKLGVAGQKHAAQFAPGRIAKQVMQVYQELM